MPSTDEIYSKLQEVFNDTFDEATVQLSPQTTADDVKGWDSLGHVRLVVAIEQAMGVRFTAEEATSMKSVGELVDLIQEKSDAGATA